MASTAGSKAIVCDSGQQKPAMLSQSKRKSAARRIRLAEPPAGCSSGRRQDRARLCTLRAYGEARAGGVMRTAERNTSSFFASLTDYVESSRKSYQFEIVSGRLAMVAFAAAVSVEVVIGDSIFQKLDLQQMAEAAGVCVAVVAGAVTFAWISSARSRFELMITLGCNSFVDSLINHIVEALFYDSELD